MNPIFIETGHMGAKWPHLQMLLMLGKVEESST